MHMAHLDGSLQMTCSNFGREKAVRMVIRIQYNCSEQKVLDFLQHSASSINISNTTTFYTTMTSSSTSATRVQWSAE
eukprot:7289652-Ditylum_brightwellii.AAC.1